jgi:AcrR family transcriptional regulator
MNARVSKTRQDTRLALLRAAERLFAAKGVDAVSLREIAAAAGQGNHSAAAYHFSHKRELINAVLERHSGPIQAGWLATLDHMRSEGRESLEELVSLLVRSLVRKLDDPDGGADYLLVVAELVTSRTFPITTLPATSAPGILKLMAALMRHVESVPFNLLPLRMMRVAAVLYCSIADYHRLVTSGHKISREEFTADLITSLIGLLSAKSRRIDGA